MSQYKESKLCSKDFEKQLGKILIEIGELKQALESFSKGKRPELDFLKQYIPALIGCSKTGTKSPVNLLYDGFSKYKNSTAICNKNFKVPMIKYSDEINELLATLCDATKQSTKLKKPIKCNVNPEDILAKCGNFRTYMNKFFNCAGKAIYYFREVQRIYSETSNIGEPSSKM